jgi:cytochrome c553
MRRLYAVGFAVVLLGGGACDKTDDPNMMATKKPDAGKVVPKAVDAGMAKAPSGDVERGAYLATSVALCAGCHTPMGPQGPDMSRVMAGGMEMKESFGVLRTPNVTMDPDTGIGKWTDEQIMAAIRTGQRPDGTMLIPIMPYTYYNKMSDDDLKAIVAWMKSLPPVKNQVQGNADVKFPRPPGPVPVQPPPADRGEYLAVLATCAHCHTPMGKQGPDEARMYAGGMEFPTDPMMGKGVAYSSNITQDEKTGIAKYTEQDIANAITKGIRPDGSHLAPPMGFLPMIWMRMKPDDVAALSKFIKGLKPIANKVPATKFEPSEGWKMMMQGPPPGAPPGGGPPGGPPGSAPATAPASK